MKFVHFQYYLKFAVCFVIHIKFCIGFTYDAAKSIFKRYWFRTAYHNLWQTRSTPIFNKICFQCSSLKDVPNNADLTRFADGELFQVNCSCSCEAILNTTCSGLAEFNICPKNYCLHPRLVNSCMNGTTLLCYNQYYEVLACNPPVGECSWLLLYLILTLFCKTPTRCRSN